MKKKHNKIKNNKPSPILVIALGVAVVSGYLVYWDKIHPSSTVEASVHQGVVSNGSN